MKNNYYYKGANPTVDLIIINPNNEVLLIKRSESSPACPGMWAIPGGFVDTNAKQNESWTEGMETPEQAAIREVKEETGYEISDLKYICSQTIFDPRFDNITEGIKTTLYMAGVYHWNAFPDDDIVECKWFTINDLNIERDFVEEHQPIALWFTYWIQEYLRNMGYARSSRS